MKPILDIFGREQCYMCTQAVELANRFNLSGTFYRVPEDVPISWLKLNYPQFIDEHYVDGIALPIVLKDGELLGGLRELWTFVADYQG